MLKQEGLSMARNGTNLKYHKMTFLLMMLMVLNLFILSNGLMLTLFMSTSMFRPVIRNRSYPPYLKDNIYVCDLLMDINSRARLQVGIKLLPKLLLYILNFIAYYEVHGDTKVKSYECDIEQLQDIPQQEHE